MYNKVLRSGLGNMQLLNARGACSNLHQREIYKILNEKKIVFGIVETKATKDRFNKAVRTLGDKWEVMTNQEVGTEFRDSIWIGFRRKTWIAEVLEAHQQCMHIR